MIAATILTLGAPNISTAQDSRIVMSEAEAWRRSQHGYNEHDSNFYAAHAAYGRAELEYRHFRNRHCALRGLRERSLYHAMVDKRERLDKLKLRISVLWPELAGSTPGLVDRIDTALIKRCDDAIAADESFGAMVATTEAAEFIMDLIERNHLSPKDPQ